MYVKAECMRRLHRVAPLYHHVFPPAYAPTLAFIGLPWKVVPFPQFELQARWVARALSGAVSLPDAPAMAAAVQSFYESLAASGVAGRYTHCQGDSQWQYNAELAAMSDMLSLPGVPEVAAAPQWREAMYRVAGEVKRSCPETYRDAWPEDDGGLVAAAAAEAAAIRAAKAASMGRCSKTGWPQGVHGPAIALRNGWQAGCEQSAVRAG